MHEIAENCELVPTAIDVPAVHEGRIATGHG